MRNRRASDCGVRRDGAGADNRAALRAHYRDSSRLAKRQALFDFVDPSRSSGPPPLETVAWSGYEAVLDAGCGNGVWTAAVRPLVSSVVGLDLSRGMLGDATAKLADAAFVNGDVVALPFADASFDVVLCFWVLHHVPDQPAAVAEFARVLRSDGTLLATANSGQRRPVDR